MLKRITLLVFLTLLTAFCFVSCGKTDDTEIADKSVHRLAGNFIITALIIQQLTLLFFVLVRSG